MGYLNILTFFFILSSTTRVCYDTQLVEEKVFSSQWVCWLSTYANALPVAWQYETTASLSFPYRTNQWIPVRSGLFSPLPSPAKDPLWISLWFVRSPFRRKLRTGRQSRKPTSKREQTGYVFLRYCQWLWFLFSSCFNIRCSFVFLSVYPYLLRFSSPKSSHRSACW